jgi:hypothetical protein
MKKSLEEYTKRRLNFPVVEITEENIKDVIFLDIVRKSV